MSKEKFSSGCLHAAFTDRGLCPSSETLRNHIELESVLEKRLYFIITYYRLIQNTRFGYIFIGYDCRVPVFIKCTTKMILSW